MSDPLIETIDRLVAEESAKIPGEVYVAIRIATRSGEKVGLAFMGTYLSEEEAKARCQDNMKKSILKWVTRGSRNAALTQWATQDIPGASTKGLPLTWNYYVAQQEVRN